MYFCVYYKLKIAGCVHVCTKHSDIPWSSTDFASELRSVCREILKRKCSLLHFQFDTVGLSSLTYSHVCRVQIAIYIRIILSDGTKYIAIPRIHREILRILLVMLSVTDICQVYVSLFRETISMESLDEISLGTSQSIRVVHFCTGKCFNRPLRNCTAVKFQQMNNRC